MSVRRFVDTTFFGVAAGITAVAIMIGGLWLYFAEPWYDGEVIRELRSGSRDAPWRDETSQVTKLFPQGTSEGSATTLLGASGFSCAAAGVEPSRNDIRLSCTRETRDFFCVGRYVVDLVVDRDRKLTDRSGKSYIVCW